MTLNETQPYPLRRWAGAGIALVFCAFECAGSIPSAAAPPSGYSLVWSDEFNQGVGKGPDLTKWQFETGPSHVNAESEIYTSDREHVRIVADPAAADGQTLQILSTASGPAFGGPSARTFESGKLNSAGKYSFQYGFVEARIRLPYGQGIWPAFWMLGDNINQIGWPRCGEVDIMENIGMRSWWGRNLSSLHSGSAATPTVEVTQNAPYNLPDGQYLFSGYHLFQMLWIKDAISFYVDGNLFETRTAAGYGTNPWPFNAPFFLILNTAVGGDWPGYPDTTTVFPQRMLVDYIRIYKGNPMPPPAPRDLTATPDDNGRILLSWKGSVADTGYDIYRGTTRGGEDSVPIKTAVAATTFADTGLTPHTHYVYRIVATNPAGSSQASQEAVAMAPDNSERPFGSKTAAIPGMIDLEDFDRGGEGVAYHDSDPENHGGAARVYDGVDIEASGDGGFDVGWTAAGEWMNYTVDVAKSGAYQATLLAASDGKGGTLHLEDETGTKLSGTVTVAGTGGWQKWNRIAFTVTLTRGRHRLRLFEDTGGYNLKSLIFTPSAP